MVTYIDEVTLTSGTTKDTFGTIGTITLNSQARRILAIINSGCDTVYTTAQGYNVRLMLNSSSLAIADQEFAVGPYVTSGPATNSSGQSMVPEVIPLDLPCAGNEILSFSTAPTTTVVTGASNMVSVMYTDGMSGLNNSAPVAGSYGPPVDWLTKFPDPVPARGGYVSDAQQLTTTRTALATINVPSWVSEIIAVKGIVLKNGAITTAQYEQVVFEVTSSIVNITPMKFPSNSDGSTLGTPVGTGMYHEAPPWIPVHIRSTGKNETIIPYVNLVNAVSTGNEVIFGVLWR